MNIIIDHLKEHEVVFHKVRENLLQDIEQAASMVIQTLINKKKILFFGNGGSAADAQHLAAELSGRYKIERKGLPGIALSTDTSALTAIGNDYGFDEVFRRQVEAIASQGDLLYGISTSGNSTNVNKAIEFGRSIGCKTIGITGRNGGNLKKLSDLCIVVPSDNTAIIQEVHITIGHIICGYIDNYYMHHSE
jgi:D-sedoheptulose 7-phosphate isomerase